MNHVGWRDGCNSFSGNYVVAGDRLTITGQRTTLVACSFPREDVHYEQVTRHELIGHRLTLYTPTQIYVLTRSPYSRLNEHPWSLYSITERKTGASHNVDRFRMDDRQLLFTVDADRTFRFVDLDGSELTGTIQVADKGRVRLALDVQSQQRLSHRRRKQARLHDSGNNFKLTNELYPTTYAEEVQWSEVTSFRVFRGDIVVIGHPAESRVLELYTDRMVYRFIPH